MEGIGLDGNTLYKVVWVEGNEPVRTLRGNFVGQDDYFLVFRQVNTGITVRLQKSAIIKIEGA